MTSPIAAEIRSLPPDQQLGAALAVIEDLTGQDNSGIRYLIETMGLSTGMARVLWVLHRASPRVLTREQLATAIWGHGDAGDDRSVDSYIKRIRARAGIEITTYYGIGYALPQPLNIPTPPMAEVVASPAQAEALRNLAARLGQVLAEVASITDEIATLSEG